MVLLILVVILLSQVELSQLRAPFFVHDTAKKPDRGESARLARVLPEVSAVISAGGTGTLLSALAAGLPLVIRPVMADQPLNATRAEHLGVSRTLRTSTDVARLIGEVLDDPRYREAAERVRRANAALPSPGAVLSDLLSRLS